VPNTKKGLFLWCSKWPCGVISTRFSWVWRNRKRLHPSSITCNASGSRGEAQHLYFSNTASMVDRVTQNPMYARELFLSCCHFCLWHCQTALSVDKDKIITWYMYIELQPRHQVASWLKPCRRAPGLILDRVLAFYDF
jgi:hypothetical protein